MTYGCCVQARDRYCDQANNRRYCEIKFVFVLKITLPRIHLASLCPGRREVRPRISTPLQHLLEYGIYLIYGGNIAAGLSGQREKYS